MIIKCVFLHELFQFFFYFMKVLLLFKQTFEDNINTMFNTNIPQVYIYTTNFRSNIWGQLVIKCFWKKSLLLIKAVFICLKIQYNREIL